MEHTPGRALTLKQRKFALAYAGETGGNGTQAARIAGYSGSDVALAVTAHENLRKPKIQQLIRSLREDAERQAREPIMSAHKTLVRISQIADGSLTDVHNEDGVFDLEDAKRRGTDYLVKKVKERRTIIHRPRYARRRTNDNEEYVQPKHDYRLTAEGKFNCVGCDDLTTLTDAIAKLAAGEPCTMEADDQVERVEYITTEYTIEDRIKALELLMKHHHLLEGIEELDVDAEIAKLLGIADLPPIEVGQIIDAVTKILEEEADQQLNKPSDESKKVLP